MSDPSQTTRSRFEPAARQRFDNSFKYSTPNIFGLIGSVTYGLGERTPRSTSASLKYSSGPLIVSGGYSSEGGAVNAITGTKLALQNALISVAYNSGPARVGFGYNRGQYKGVTSTGGDLAPQNELNLRVSVPISLWILSAGYAQSKGDDLGKSSGFGAQAFYLLSKRTMLYVGGVSTSNYDKVAAAARIQAPRSNVDRTTLYGVGIRHTF